MNEARLEAWKANPVQGIDIAVAAFAEKIQVAIPLVVEKLAVDLWTKITRGNPVDTGLSRSWWKISEGAPDMTAPPKRESAAANQFPAPETPTPTITGTAPVYITNNVDYVIFLEAGWSGQAPFGYVGLAILETVAEVDTILKSLEDK